MCVQKPHAEPQTTLKAHHLRWGPHCTRVPKREKNVA